MSYDHDRRTGFRLAPPDQHCPRTFSLVWPIVPHGSRDKSSNLSVHTSNLAVVTGLYRVWPEVNANVNY
jgi:hypothetical protein